MLLYDLVDIQELQGFVRQVQDEVEQNQFNLRQFLPNLNIDDIEFRVRQGSTRDVDAAMVRTWDAESPIARRYGKISQLIGELPPISEKIPLTEEERLRRRSLERGDNQPLIDQIYDDAANRVRAVTARLEMLRGEVLWRGAITINENGVFQDVPMGRKVAHDVAPATLWSVTASATPVTDEMAWVKTYRTTNGINPALALTSQDVVDDLLMNAQYQTLFYQGRTLPDMTVQAPFLTFEQLNQVRRAYGLPPLVVDDTLVRVNGVQQRVIPADRLIYLPPANEPLGRTFFGTTVEALELVEARQIAGDQAPGLVSVIEKTFDPVHIWTKVACIGMPVLINPDLTLVADVR